MHTMLNLITKLSETTSRNEKINILVDSLNSPRGVEVWNVFNLALNPFYNYGCRTVETGVENELEKDFEDECVVACFKELQGLSHSYATYECIHKLMLMLSKDNQEVAKRIILKDLRCGVQIATFNLALKKSLLTKSEIPDYPCMLTSAYSDKLLNKLDFEGDTIYCQEKCDGMRFNAIVNYKETISVEFRGRSGKPISIPNAEFAKELIALANNGFDNIEGVVFDGELLVVENGKVLERKTGNGILNKCVRGTISQEEAKNIVCVLWDAIDLTDFKNGYQEPKMGNQYKFRFVDLCNAFIGKKFERVQLVNTKVVKSRSEIETMFEEMLSDGKEGVIVKSGKNIWKNTRVTDQIKFKSELDCDLEIVEVVEGTGKYVGQLGSILCRSSDGKVVVSVGSGFTDADRNELWENRHTLVGKVVTVVYNARICDKNREEDSLFLPRFIELREDKSVANASSDIK